MAEKELPQEQEGELPGVLKASLIALIVDQELGADGADEEQKEGSETAARQALRRQLENIDTTAPPPVLDVGAPVPNAEEIAAQHRAEAAAAAAEEAEKIRWAEVRASAARAAAAAAAAPQASREASAAADAAYWAKKRADEARKREREAHEEAAAAAAAAATIGPPPSSLLDPVHPMVLLGGQVEEQACKHTSTANASRVVPGRRVEAVRVLSRERF